MNEEQERRFMDLILRTFKSQARSYKLQRISLAMLWILFAIHVLIEVLSK